MKQSKFMRLGISDIGKGVLIAFVSAAAFPIIKNLESGEIPSLEQIKTYAVVGVAAALGYLLKNLFTNSENKLLKTDSK